MAYIDDRIAELEQRIAEKKAYQRMHSPHKYASTWDYVAEGDRSGFDRMDAEEMAYRNMLAQQAQQNAILKAQQEFNAKENELNRQNALKLAKISRTGTSVSDIARIQKELELADADVQMTNDNLDINDPESVRNHRKAVLNRKYWATQMPAEFGLEIKDYEYTEPTKSSSKVIIRNAKKGLDALIKLDPNNWNNEQKALYNELMSQIPDEDPDKLLYTVNLKNKGRTTEQREVDKASRKAEWEQGKKLSGYDYRKWKESPKGKKLIAEFGE